MSQNLDQKRKKIETTVKIIAMLVIGFIVSPFILLAVKGLVGLVVAAIVGIIILQFAPVFAAMIANWRLKAIKAEARRNPVETLQNTYMQREESLKKYRDSIVTFRGKINTFETRLKNFKHEAEKQQFIIIRDKMKSLLELRQQKLEQADLDLKRFAQELVKANDIWEMGNAAEALTEAAGMSEDDFLQKIQTQTAIYSIQEKLDLAFAELDQSLADEQMMQSSKQLKVGEKPVNFVNVKSEAVKVN